MPEDTREQHIDAIRRGVAAGRALPAACYRDPAFFELEREHVLRPGWHAVARWDELPNPGDYASVDICDEPLLLARDEAGTLRVFSRVCRHRAHIIVEGRGNAKRFTCPYHLWTYGLDGSLRGAPMMGDSFRADQCGLPELRTEAWQGFVFVTLDPDAEPIAEQLAPLTELLAPHGMDKLVTVGVSEWDSPWNWKVMVDNFMESYHHIGPHAQSLQKANRAQDTYCMDLDGPFALLENPGHAGASDFYVAQVFPTLLLALFRGDAIGSWYEMQIDRHDHFHLRIHMLATPELAATDGAADFVMESSRAIHLEDIGVCEGVQRGIASRLWEPGPLSKHEGALLRFHQHLMERLTR